MQDIKSAGLRQLEEAIAELKPCQRLPFKEALAELQEEQNVLLAEIRKQQHRIDLQKEDLESYYKSYQG